MATRTEIRAEDLKPGQMRSTNTEGLELLVANIDGRHFAINNVCTHRQCPLTGGMLDGNVITCACHGSQFDVTTGRVLRGPATRDEATYAIHVEEGFLAIDVRQAAA
ncbi:MAG: Rieske (2Fe-2S) protein [Candidatus Aquicultorales bacterium]